MVRGEELEVCAHLILVWKDSKSLPGSGGITSTGASVLLGLDSVVILQDYSIFQLLLIVFMV
jgi:hypothetical protein